MQNTSLLLSSTKPWWKIQSNVAAARDYAYTAGLLQWNKDHCGNMPVTVKPSLYPRDLFELISTTQTGFNSVLDALCQDYDLVHQSLERVMKTDSFVKSLFDIYSEVKELGNVQTTALGIHRADYLLDVSSSNKLSVKQVEINTISGGSPGIASKMNNFHEYIQSRFLARDQPKLVPHDNPALVCVNDGLARAWREYGNTSAHILFVVQKNEGNIYDHRLMEQDLFNRHKIMVIRRTLSQIEEEGRLRQDRTLIIGGIEVAVIYFRAGYTPNDYPTDKEWAARRMMDLSRASNCPSVAYQLVGFKKFQQILATPDILEKFCNDPDMIKAMRSTFTGHYTIDQTPEGDAAMKLALGNPHGYVLKPQREAGGNNLYDDQLYSTLLELASSPKREAFVLMERIQPPAISSAVIKTEATDASEYNLIPEVGTFGIYIRKQDEVLLNIYGGYNVRTKPMGYNEGGVGVGIGSHDTICLVSEEEYLQSAVLPTVT